MWISRHITNMLSEVGRNPNAAYRFNVDNREVVAVHPERLDQYRRAVRELQALKDRMAELPNGEALRMRFGGTAVVIMTEDDYRQWHHIDSNSDWRPVTVPRDEVM